MNGESQVLYRFDAQLDFSPVGLVPEGLRVTGAFDGVITDGLFMDGPLAGARVWGVDHFLLRLDGVGIVDAPKTLSRDGLNVYEHVRGYALPPEGMELPPLEEIVKPDFEWPDVHFLLHGFSTFRVAAPELAWLNRAHAEIQGWVSMATGALAVETRLVTPRAGIALPRPMTEVSRREAKGSPSRQRQRELAEVAAP